ncbi:MAG: phytoene desaturase [Crocinitomix sp.]|nr:phytoene desaturase [Crocinitomix sp.]
MTIQPKYDVVVIGAGLGGIAAALRLKKMGLSILVVEKNPRHGGKLEEWEWEGYRWDRGPSLFTLPEQVDELFELYGKNPREFFKYKKIDNCCHYYFNDGTNFLFRGNIEDRNEDFIKHFYEREGQAAIAYLKKADKTYNAIGGLFIDNPKYGLKNIFDKALLKRYPLLMTKMVRGSLNALNSDTFENPNLVQLFDRYATYNGSDPFRTSGLYSMISHLESNNGTFFPDKGMRSIADSLYDLAVEEGVEFSFNQTVTANREGSGYKVNLNEDNVIADRLVSAIDCVKFYENVINDKPLTKRYGSKERSSSAIIFYWAVDKVIPELQLHNIFFSPSYQQEYHSLFRLNKIDATPSVYIHVSSVVNSEDAPKNGQNWFIMINAPAGVTPSEEQKEKLRILVYKLIQEKFAVDITKSVLYEKIWDAAGIEEETGAYAGALYGASSNAKLAALTRHGNASKKYKNLYFVGGTVHPGGGLPLVLKSSKIVANIIEKEK